MLSIIQATPQPGYKLHLVFSDGAQGIADLSEISRTGVFAAWDDVMFFDQVVVDPESGTVVWPGGVDLDPFVLYSRVGGGSTSQEDDCA